MNPRKTFPGNMSLHWVILISLGLLLVFYVLLLTSNYLDRPQRQARLFQQNFTRQQEILKECMSTMKGILSTEHDFYWPELERVVDHRKMIVQIYRRDSLFYWNSRKITNEISRINPDVTDTVIFLKTGWYVMHRNLTGDYDLFLLKQIKAEYAYNNSYLPNAFDADFTGFNDVQLTQDLGHAEYIIQGLNDKPCLGLNIYDSAHAHDNVLMGLFLVFLLFYLSVIILVEKLYEKVSGWTGHHFLLLLFYATDLVILRLIDHFTGFPAVLKDSFLFAGSDMAVPGWTTPGDFLLNTLIISAIALKINRLTFVIQPPEKERKWSFLAIVAAIFLLLLTWALFYAMYAGLQILDYHAIFGLKLWNGRGVIIVAGVLLIMLSLYLLMNAFTGLLNLTERPMVPLVIVWIAAGLSIYFFLPGHTDITLAAWIATIGYAGIVLYLPGNWQTQPLKLLLIIILFSLSGTAVINQIRNDKKDDHQSLTVQQLSVTRDLALEGTFASVVDSIGEDPLVEDIILNYIDPEQNLQSYFQGTYFSGLMDKYSIQVTVCEGEGSLIEDMAGMEYDCEEYFDFIMEDLGSETEAAGLKRIDSRPETIYYLGKIEIPADTAGEDYWKLFVELYYSYVPEGLGYTELLVDNSTTTLDLTYYSFAVYENSALKYKFGNFAYYTSAEFLDPFRNGRFFNLMNFRHVKLQIGEDKFLIVSRPVDRISEKVMGFSGLFLALLLLTFLYYALRLVAGADVVIQLSFRNRLQMIFVSTISLIITILAAITLLYAESNNEQNTIDQLNEKTISVLVELDYKLMGVDSPEDIDQEEMQQMLEKFSEVFFSDINLYSVSGQLIATSRREIFTKGLLSENINPMAYEELFIKNKLSYITAENIGSAVYYSSYVPLFLGSYQPAGVVNLPYFAKQSEVLRSYYLMLFTFVNMFVVLGIAGTLLALLLSRVLTRPLLLLQESLRSLQIDKENERLEWGRNDEIGQLIAEYNRMVEKLEQSAELLKHSERESAWREVAQQIAHEIKNPLTPMKLNVQHLEKVYEQGDPNNMEKIKNISASLISQIESLNQVAEMFSNFAKTNAGNLERVDLIRTLNTSAALYRNQHALQLSFEQSDQADRYITLGIEKDLIRVFNNLFKNAIQAMEEKAEKLLEIRLDVEEAYIIVRISDNGKGIPAGAKQNIFRPYFTTKSGGTGLGLAITRNIMHEIGGEIKFEDRTGGGTTFVLYFRKLS